MPSQRRQWYVGKFFRPTTRRPVCPTRYFSSPPRHNWTWTMGGAFMAISCLTSSYLLPQAKGSKKRGSFLPHTLKKENKIRDFELRATTTISEGKCRDGSVLTCPKHLLSSFQPWPWGHTSFLLAQLSAWQWLFTTH